MERHLNIKDRKLAMLLALSLRDIHGSKTTSILAGATTMAMILDASEAMEGKGVKRKKK